MMPIINNPNTCSPAGMWPGWTEPDPAADITLHSVYNKDLMRENFSESLIHHLAKWTISTCYHWGLTAADFAARQYSHVRCPDRVQAACVHTETRRTGAEKQGGEIWRQQNPSHWKPSRFTQTIVVIEGQSYSLCNVMHNRNLRTLSVSV